MGMKILKLSRGKTGPKKNTKLELAHFSVAKPEELEARQQQLVTVEAGVGVAEQLLQSNLPAKNIRKAGKSIYLKCL